MKRTQIFHFLVFFFSTKEMPCWCVCVCVCVFFFAVPFQRFYVFGRGNTLNWIIMLCHSVLVKAIFEALK